MTTHLIRLSLISISPALARIPMMRDVAAKFLASPKPELKKVGADATTEHQALMESLERHGILEPIKCYRDGRRWVAVDGRHRLEWVRTRLQEEDQERLEDLQESDPNRLVKDDRSRDPKVPIIEISREDADKIIEASVIGRRHWTKGQRGWLGVLQHPEVCEAGEGRPKNSDSVGVFTATSLAGRLGVSADVVTQAVNLYRLLYAPGAKPKSAEAIEAAAKREKYEHLIWGGAGLGAIIAGIGGGDATSGKPKGKTGFHHLDAPLGSLARLSKVFSGWDADERAKAQQLITERVTNDLTPEFRLALAEALAAAHIA